LRSPSGLRKSSLIRPEGRIAAGGQSALRRPRRRLFQANPVPKLSQARLRAAPYGAKAEAKLNERSEVIRTDVRRPALEVATH